MLDQLNEFMKSDMFMIWKEYGQYTANQLEVPTHVDGITDLNDIFETEVQPTDIQINYDFMMDHMTKIEQAYFYNGGSDAMETAIEEFCKKMNYHQVGVTFDGSGGGLHYGSWIIRLK